VQVTGAAPELGRLQVARTAPIDVNGLTAGRHERRVPLAPLPEHLSYVEPPQVVVTLNVVEEIASRTLGDLDVSVVGASDATVRPRQVNVRVRGPRARVEALSPGRVVPFVDVTELDATRGAQPVTVQVRGVPEGMEANAEPAEVLVVVPPAR
jgi:YbbR domain-containing protein